MPTLDLGPMKSGVQTLFSMAEDAFVLNNETGAVNHIKLVTYPADSW